MAAQVARRTAISASATAAIVVALAFASPARAVQTFPDPFGGEGVFTDLRAGSNGEDVGDAFFLRDGDALRIEMFLADADEDVHRTFIESHVCLSAEAFTGRIPPGLCQFQAEGATASSYDITLPPAFFPGDTEPFDDPLGPFCVQVHVSYAQPALSITRDGGGGAFAGWQSGRPFYGNVCFATVPEPLPPDVGTAMVKKAGELVAGDVVFTVTATNPTAEEAPDVVVFEALPARLAPWTVPSECTLETVDFVARCEIGNLAGGVSVELVFSATPAADVCGSFSNYAFTTVGSPVVRSTDLVIVDVPCPDPPPAPDPLMLLTIEPSSTLVPAPDTVTYFMSVENAGPGTATKVSFADVLSDDIEWSIGSGENVCSIEGSSVTCFAEEVPDGVFEVLEIIGTVDATDCGTYDYTGTIMYEGGPQPASVSDAAPTVEVTGCPAPGPGGGSGPGDGDGTGELPDTSSGTPLRSGPFALVAAFAVAASVLTLRRRLRA